MQTKSQLARIFVFLYVLGIALLIAGFLYVVPKTWQTHTTWLDLVVVCVIFSVYFPLISIGYWRTDGFNLRIPSLGLLWVTGTMYSSLAGGCIRYGLVRGVSFRIQLAEQVFLFFAGAVAVTVASFASAHVAEVTEEQRVIRAGLVALRAAIDRCESAMSLDPAHAGRDLQMLRKLKDDARYLSPSIDAKAISYEEQIIAEVDGIRLLLGNNSASLPPRDLDVQFRQCAALMALRKQVLN